MNLATEKTFFTIVIPTRERSNTLMHAIATAITQNYENFEVLISDNASLDDTRNKVESQEDSRIKYINTGRRVSMSENWEFALNHVSNGWVTVLGDDDGILPGTLRYVDQLIRKTKVKAIRSNGCSYIWPDLIGQPNGSLSISKQRGVVIKNSAEMLQKTLDGKSHYTELPVLYNGGFISTDLINKVKEISGKMFLSMSPDVYSGIVFSFLTDEYAYCYEPLAINGASAHSGGTANFEKTKRKRDYDPAEKFLSEPNIPFHSSLPLSHDGRPVRSIPVIVYETFLQAQAFHKFKNIMVSKEKQAAIALDQSGPKHDEIIDWSEQFIKKHQLNVSLVSSSRRGFFSKKYNKIHNIIRKIMNFATSIHVKGNDQVPLTNVFEASIVGGFIKKIQPSTFKNIKLYFMG